MIPALLAATLLSLAGLHLYWAAGGGWGKRVTLPEILRRDRNFRIYLLSQIGSYLSGMATGFLVVYTVETWHLSDAEAGGFVIAMQAGLTLRYGRYGLTYAQTLQTPEFKGQKSPQPHIVHVTKPAW